MGDADEPKAARNRSARMFEVVAVGEELIRLADELGLSIAALHLCQGIAIIREEAERLSSRPH